MAKIRTSIKYKEVEIPVEVHLETRRTLRAAFGKDKVIVRIPKSLTKEEQRLEYQTAKDWVAKTLDSKPAYLVQFIRKDYNNTVISVMDKSYDIIIHCNNLKSCRARLDKETVNISMPEEWDDRLKSEMVQKTLAKLFAKVCKKQIIQDVLMLNQKHFQKGIKSVQLKYNKSNWGSCSSQKNINLSSRLLLVPAKVRSYVIIHELAHLTEMNHSDRFWKIVEKACPDYKVHENWLTEHGPSIDF